jgi:hypothetical protein
LAIGIAKRILETDPNHLEVTTKKIRALCGEDLRRAAATGTTSHVLHGIITMMRVNLKSDTRANEQFNSLIRVINDRCRNIGLDTLDARCSIKKQLGVGTRGVNLRWSSIRPHASTVLVDAVQNFEQGSQQAYADGRWLTPPPTPGLASEQALKATIARLFPMISSDHASLRWAAHFGPAFSKLTSEVSAERGFSVTAAKSAKAGSDLFLSVENNYSQRMLVKLKVFPHRLLARRLVARLCLPLEMMTSAALLTKFHEQVRTGHPHHVIEYGLTWRFESAGGGDDLFAELTRASKVHFALKKVRVPTDAGASKAGPSSGGHGGDMPPPPLPPPPLPPPADTDGDDQGGLAGDVDDVESLAEGVLEEWLEEALNHAAGFDGEAEAQFEKWMADDLAEMDADGMDQADRKTVDDLEQEASSSSSSSKKSCARKVATKIIAHAERAFERDFDADADLDGMYDEKVLFEVAFGDVDMNEHTEEPTADVGQSDVAMSAVDALSPEPLAVAQDVAYPDWQASFAQSCEALRARDAALELVPIGREFPWELSLVSVSQGDSRRTVVVQWSYVQSLKGRAVRIDPETREVIWPTAATSPVVCFKNAEVIHPAIGVHAQRLREGRPCLPAQITRLRTMWDIALSEKVPLHAECQLCNAGDMVEPIALCAFCQLQWHESCCCSLLGRRAALCGVGLKLPDVVSDSMVCRLCAKSLQRSTSAGGGVGVEG